MTTTTTAPTLTFLDLKGAVRLSNDGDSWGTCYGWIMAVAFKLEFDGPGAPEDWRFEPGACVYSENWRMECGEFEIGTLDAAADLDLIESFGELLWRWRSKLKAADRAY